MKYWFCILTALATLASAQERRAVPLPNQPGGAANLSLTVYLVYGLAEVQPVSPDEVPQDLAGTLQQLRGVPYKSYKLLESVTLRGRNNGGAEVGGQLSDYSFYDFKYGRARISAEAPHTVRLDSLRLEITRRRSNRIDTVALVSTDLDVRDGQKLSSGNPP